MNTAGTQAGDTIAVVGLGAVGMNALFAAVAGGAERIIAIDTSAEKLGLARQWGATDTFLATDADCVEWSKAATDGGVDTVIETAGRRVAGRVPGRGVGAMLLGGLGAFSLPRRAG